MNPNNRVMRAVGYALAAAAIGAMPALAQKDVASCKPLFDAMRKQHQTATHMYTTTAKGGAAPRTMEMISVGNANYLQIRGQWKSSPMSPKEMQEQEDENIRDAKALACKRLRDESVNGVSATAYSMHSDTGFSTEDGQFWVGKSNGLPVKAEYDITIDAGEKTHYVTRYEYAGVKAPI
jgi:hypothetical protein